MICEYITEGCGKGFKGSEFVASSEYSSVSGAHVIEVVEKGGEYKVGNMVNRYVVWTCSVGFGEDVKESNWG